MGIQPGSAVDVAAGTYEDPDSAFLLCFNILEGSSSCGWGEEQIGY